MWRNLRGSGAGESSLKTLVTIRVACLRDCLARSEREISVMSRDSEKNSKRLTALVFTLFSAKAFDSFSSCLLLREKTALEQESPSRRLENPSVLAHQFRV